ncbi:MAG: class SAM-dependent methyltransferase [Marmoricola sp.]|nr:class SAM-dependent methyltransferase [Marmoricola sp.]
MVELSPGAVPSPNIWHHPDLYEVENRAVDRAGAITALMQSLAPWAGRDVLDVGCGTGFHLPVFAATAGSVTGVEPHGDLAAIARRRVRRLSNVSVLHASVTSLPLPPASVDVVHARWAYFFGPGCEPGLAELDRVVRRGGRAFVIDNDATRSTFGAWFRRGYPGVDPVAVAAFWESRGWERHPVDMAWTFDSREDLEAVVRIEFAGDVAEEILAGHEGTSVDYAVNVWGRAY